MQLKSNKMILFNKKSFDGHNVPFVEYRTNRARRFSLPLSCYYMHNYLLKRLRWFRVSRTCAKEVSWGKWTEFLILVWCSFKPILLRKDIPSNHISSRKIKVFSPIASWNASKIAKLLIVTANTQHKSGTKKLSLNYPARLKKAFRFPNTR